MEYLSLSCLETERTSRGWSSGRSGRCEAVFLSGQAGFLIFCLLAWLSNDTYGVNYGSSLIYMGILYLVALAIYVGFRLLRRAQGINLNMVYDEIPEE